VSISSILDKAKASCENASSINELSQHFLWNISSSNYRVCSFAFLHCLYFFAFLVRNTTLWISIVDFCSSLIIFISCLL